MAAPTEPVAADPVPPNADPVSAEPEAAEPAAADPTAAEPVPRMLARPAKPSPTTGVGVMGGGGAETRDGAVVDDVVERPGMVRWPSYWPSSDGVGPAEPDGPCCATPAPAATGWDTGVPLPGASPGHDISASGRGAATPGRSEIEGSGGDAVGPCCRSRPVPGADAFGPETATPRAGSATAAPAAVGAPGGELCGAVGEGRGAAGAVG
ncbi:hypothetical protein C5E45_01870 [Nocardia nova]|uniref:Uncharacterized protein n=1 Tax=Nocardia nova TaxID=37330 RepID=A0A2S6AXF0_9NOCA|nr:hypothetical protein C5E41_01585 [Nocardia nova]PPJ39890.1 hypothetical protein C5E45_01870 [Nocardia nova]